jgi:hypothetical protein
VAVVEPPKPPDLALRRALGTFALALALIGAIAVAAALISRRRRAGPPV